MTDISIRSSGISPSHNQTFPIRSLLYYSVAGVIVWISWKLAIKWPTYFLNVTETSIVHYIECRVCSTNTVWESQIGAMHTTVLVPDLRGSGPELKRWVFLLNRCKRLIQSTPSNTKDSTINNSVPSNLIKDLARIVWANLNKNHPKTSWFRPFSPK